MIEALISKEKGKLLRASYVWVITYLKNYHEEEFYGLMVVGFCVFFFTFDVLTRKAFFKKSTHLVRNLHYKGYHGCRTR